MPHEIPESMMSELGDWNDGAGVPLEAWIENEGNFRLAVGYTAVFWPKFEAVGKYIFVEGTSAESIQGFERQRNSTPESVEAVLNHLHLADLHPYDGADLSADKLMCLGGVMKEMWKAKLKWQFPDRPCHVEFFVPDDPDDLESYEITFWQKS